MPKPNALKFNFVAPIATVPHSAIIQGCKTAARVKGLLKEGDPLPPGCTVQIIKRKVPDKEGGDADLYFSMPEPDGADLPDLFLVDLDNLDAGDTYCIITEAEQSAQDKDTQSGNDQDGVDRHHPEVPL